MVPKLLLGARCKGTGVYMCSQVDIRCQVSQRFYICVFKSLIGLRCGRGFVYVLRLLLCARCVN